jgi:hypothetical protein
MIVTMIVSGEGGVVLSVLTVHDRTAYSSLSVRAYPTASRCSLVGVWYSHGARVLRGEFARGVGVGGVRSRPGQRV